MAREPMSSLHARSVIDRDKLLAIAGGDEAILERLLGLFERTLPEMTEAIAAAVGARDPEAVRMAAHGLKGAAASVYAPALAAAACELETAARAGRVEPALLQELETQVEVVLAALCEEALHQGA